MKKINEISSQIDGPDIEAMKKAGERLDSLTKPPGSLGKLEDIVKKLAGITGDIKPAVKNRAHLLMAADHGVAEEGVSAVPAEVTEFMVYNFLEGGAAINVLCRQAETELKVFDLGINNDIEHEDIIDKKIKYGTDNIVNGPAMSRREAIASIETGIEAACECAESGADIISTGEMGIANTTPSSAIAAVMTSRSVEEVVGRGSGIDQKTFEKKKEVVKKAIKVNDPDPQNSIEVLADLGGLEIGGMAGVILGSAASSLPVLLDGFICGVAALLACNINSGVKDYLIPSHKSVEPGHVKIYQEMGLEPMLDLDMRLGEGTGAVLNINQIEAACRIIDEMATFEEAGIDLE